MHADAWRRFHRANNVRTWPVRVAKVKAHASQANVEAVYSEQLAVGNGLADAAAKLSLTLHPTDQQAAQLVADT